ncbi:MAG: glycosyltransferase family 2 protein [Actinomycetota bacterium]|nr:glycosyltransferase family 2 protein [Actinomycetota bacterium]
MTSAAHAPSFSDRPDLSVVVPTYRGRDSLQELLERLSAVLRPRGLDYEVVVVNDASPDDTWEVLGKLAPDHPELRAIDLLGNQGQPRATLCGLAHARGDLVATMDDDLQHPPEELPKLLDALAQHPDWDAVVGAWPRDEGLLRDIGSWINETVDRLAHKTPKGFRHTAYRVMRRQVVDALLEHQTRTPVVWSLLGQVTSRVHNVEVAHRARPYGRSGFRVVHGVKLVLTSFFQASTLPLRALSAFGVLCSLLAFLIGLVLLVRYLAGVHTPQGWASSFLAIVFFGGATLFGLGLIGEYLSLVIAEVKRPPRWNVRTTIGYRQPVEPRR